MVICIQNLFYTLCFYQNTNIAADKAADNIVTVAARTQHFSPRNQLFIRTNRDVYTPRWL